MLIFALPFSISLLRREPLRWSVTLFANLSMMHSLLPWKSVYFSFNAVSWYLTLPLVFALLTPLTVKFLKASAAKLAWSIGVFIFLEFLLCLLFGEKSFAHWLLYVCPFVRYLDFLVGGGAYVLIKTFLVQGERYHDSIFPAFLLFCSVLIASMFYRNMWFVTFMWTVPSVLLIGSAYVATEKHSWGQILFENKILVEIGNISYGIFLTHQLLIRYITKIMGVMGLPVIVGYPVSLVSTIVIAYTIKKRGNLRA